MGSGPIDEMIMSKMESIIVVLASPSDLSEERKMIARLIDSYNNKGKRYGKFFDLRRWEDVSPKLDAEGAQGVIDKDLEITDADIFICMFWKNAGTVLDGENVTGTEHELFMAIDSYKESNKPDVKIFFKRIVGDDNDNIRRIKSIEDKVKPLGLYSSFDSLDELKEKIERILFDAFINCINRDDIESDGKYNYSEINTTEELIKGIMSDSKLILEKGYYDVLSAKVENNNVRIKEVFDGVELEVSDINNMTMFGLEATLVVSPSYANVISFCNCSDIRLIGLTLGHAPQKGSCVGSVLRFYNCTGVYLESLELFGCGTYGIELINCKNVYVSGTKIYECTYGALRIINSDIEFCNSMIYECKNIAGELIEAHNSQLKLDNVSIFNNQMERFLILLNKSNISCRAVCINSNEYGCLCNKRIMSGVYKGYNEEKNITEYHILIKFCLRIEKSFLDSLNKLTSKDMKMYDNMMFDGKRVGSIEVPSERLSNVCDLLDANMDVEYELR